MRLNPLGNIELDYDRTFLFRLNGKLLSYGEPVLMVLQDPDVPGPWWTLARIYQDAGRPWPMVSRPGSDSRPVYPFDYFALLPESVAELLRLGREQLEAFKRLHGPGVAELSASALADAKADLQMKEDALAAVFRQGAEVEGITVDLDEVLLADQQERGREANGFAHCAEGAVTSCVWARRCRARDRGREPDGACAVGCPYSHYMVQSPWPTWEPHRSWDPEVPGSLRKYVHARRDEEFAASQRVEHSETRSQQSQ